MSRWRGDGDFQRPSDAEDGDAGAAPAPRRYASPLIAERRARILDEAKKLIGDVGADAFTLRDLARAANVSVTTIYNIFGDKEGVIAHALREFHAGIRLVLPNNATNLSGYLRAIGDTTLVVCANRAYALALADLFFSRSLAPALFDVVRGMPLQVFSQWLWTAERDGLISARCSAAQAETSFTNMEWASVKDWGAGRIDDAELVVARQRSFLLIATAIAVDPVRSEADALLQSLR